MLKPVRIGELLIERGLVDEQTLATVVAHQATLGDALGEMLTSAGHLRPYDLYKTLADQKGYAFADLLREIPEEHLLAQGSAEEYLRYRCVPWKQEGEMVVMACVSPDEETIQFMQSFTVGRTLEVALTSPRDILRTVERGFGSVLDEKAREHLLVNAPHYSLRHAAGRGRGIWVLGGVVGALALCLLQPAVFIPLGVMVCNLFYLATMLFKPLLFLAGRSVPRLPTQQMVAALPGESDLPVYTVLVPLYGESEGVARLVRALSALDYPASRLDVKLIVEEDDEETLHAVLAAHPPAMFEVLRVPFSLPRTKPKACNYALSFARGEFVTIYDAEDLPQPDQLKKAVAVFRNVPEDVVCLQARLNYYNRRENLLTRMFALEYGGLFDFMLPGLLALGIPIPLGGTSNHLRLSRLKELGEWDPYNVTEDADLGIRLATEGLRTLPFDSLTEEEAPILISAWLKQRSRWIKGYMQTWQVAMRRAPLLLRRFGLLGFVGFQLFVGAASLVYLLSPLLWILSALWGMNALGSTSFLPDWLMVLSIGIFGAGVLIQWALALTVLVHSRWWGADMMVAVAVYPFYWLLHSWASFRALKQLFLAPHYWDKTPHGLSRLIPA